MCLPEKRIKLCYSYPINWQNITGCALRGVPGISWLFFVCVCVHEADVESTQLWGFNTLANINSLYGSCNQQRRQRDNADILSAKYDYRSLIGVSSSDTIATRNHLFPTARVEPRRRSVADKREVENHKSAAPDSSLWHSTCAHTLINWVEFDMCVCLQKKKKRKRKKDQGGTSLRAAAFHHLFACALTPVCSLSLCSRQITELYKKNNNNKKTRETKV